MKENKDSLQNLSHGLNQNSNNQSFSLLDEDLSLDFSIEEIENIKSETDLNITDDLPLVKEEEIIDQETLKDSLSTAEETMQGIEQIVNFLDKSNKEDIQELNREIHGLKGEFGMVGAKTLQMLLHKIEDCTSDYLQQYKTIKEISPVISKVFDKVKHFFGLLLDGTYEDVVNKEKEILPENEYLEKVDDTLLIINDGLSILKEDNKNQEIIDLISKNIHLLFAGLDFSRLKKHIQVSENIIENIQNSPEKIKENIELIEKNLLSFSKMIDFIISARDSGKDEKEYYEKALGSQADKINKSSRSLRNDNEIRIDIDVLNSLLREVEEARLSSTLMKSSLYVFNNALKDLQDITIRKTQSLRELEKESNSQIKSSNDIIINVPTVSNENHTHLEEISTNKKNNEDFDPLEKDSYKDLQNLTASLLESQIDLEEVLNTFSQIKNIQENYSETLDESIKNTQDTLIKTRLTPFYMKGSAEIKTMVRDAANNLGKQVKVEIFNEKTSVDRVILEKLMSQIGHTLRNSVAHGIESAEIRKKNGKPEVGLITVNLKQEGGRLSIIIKDDGAGINVAKVREKAIEKKLWDEKKPMTDAEAVDMICMPDFSTVEKEDVNLVAGRGIGMDAVKNEIISMGGRYDIESVQGKGMKVEIQIPTSISTVSSFLVTVGTETLAIPVDVIDKITTLTTEEIKEANQKGRVKVDGKDVDFKYLNDLAKIEVSPLETVKYKNLIVTSSNGISIAILVDKLIGVSDVPIKTISRTLSNIPGVVSATILSDGKAAFVYDPTRAKQSLLRYYGVLFEEGKEAFLPSQLIKNKDVENIEEKYLVMVVDDSNTVRQHTARMLNRNGYNNILAKDGKHGIDLLSTTIPDVILLDVEMPRMDGFEFARYVREHEKYHEIPIIMITSRSGDKHKNRAMEIGVNEYTAKPFNEEEILGMLKKYTVNAKK